MKKEDDLLVYSTEQGRIKAAVSHPEVVSQHTDGIVRIQRQINGRKGKPVTVITGLGLAGNELQALLGKLKKRCACGGSVKEGIVEIQGDKRDLIKEILVADGWQAKVI